MTVVDTQANLPGASYASRLASQRSGHLLGCFATSLETLPRFPLLAASPPSSPDVPAKSLIREIACALRPPELFARVSHQRGCFFLDSARQAGGLGRFSFLGFEPFLTFESRGNEIVLMDTTTGVKEKRTGDPLEELRRLMQKYRCARDPRLPFTGGAVGAFSYELCSHFERVPRTGLDDLRLPDIAFGFYDGFFAFDTESGRTWLVANPVHTGDAEKIVVRLEQTLREAEKQLSPIATPASANTPAPESNFTREAYGRAIARIKDYIADGDVYQVNLTQRFSAPLPFPPAELYRRLRALSPAPFSCYFDLGSCQIVGSSPERFLRLQGDHIETRPIKGTRPRGHTPDDDARLRAELLASEKDRAELLMIVDLERNDLGRVCEFASVHVDQLFHLEEHPTVFHLVANVSGRLRAGADVFDCLRATFPGGSITGAPKIRAMQIIDELEPHRRHFYTGAVGYLGFDGDCDLNIAIRTVLCTGGHAYYHVGGGIVWDSAPEAEYRETLDKGRAMRAALGAETP